MTRARRVLGWALVAFGAASLAPFAAPGTLAVALAAASGIACGMTLFEMIER